MSKDDLEPKELLGRWNWVSTENASTNKYYEMYQTPEITGDNITHEYSKQNILKIVKNDTLASIGKYELLEKSAMKVYINSDTLHYQYALKGHYLLLQELPELKVRHSYNRPNN